MSTVIKKFKDIPLADLPEVGGKMLPDRTGCKNDKEDNIEIEMEERVPVDQILSEVSIKCSGPCTGATRK